MAWATCQNSRETINQAGRDLITLSQDDPARDAALDVINNWRSCHAYPLTVIKNTLKKRAKSNINAKALVAQRIKRLSSIALKLRHNDSMRLTQMQDIGGCRAVLSSVVEAETLVRAYELARDKHPKADDRPLLIKKYDYIAFPKPDGYRSVHLIMNFHGKTKGKKPFNEQKIEVQIRSNLQHAWATAVETCQTFTGQALKSKIKTANASWLRFFALMSTAIAFRERRSGVPGTPTNKADRKTEILDLVAKENIIDLLVGWNTAMRLHQVHEGEESTSNAVAFLLELNVREKRLSMLPFKESEMLVAHGKYLEREKATEKDSAIQVVLVSADSVANLKRAYPNYYMDTTAFIRAVNQETATA